MNTKMNAFKSILAIALCAVGFAASAADTITYLDWDAATQQLVEKTITDYQVYDGDEELYAGTYVVKTTQTVTPGYDLLFVCGGEGSPTRLILCDGVKLTVNGGVCVGERCALIICGQAGGTGELVATGNDGAGIGAAWGDSCGTVVINGGIVTATGDSSCAGIGGDSYGGSCGTVMINGGIVKATGQNGAAGIGGGSGKANTGTVLFGGSGFSVLAGANAGAAVSVEQDAYTANHGAAYVFIKEPVSGSEGNPWKVGAPNAAGVTAYTNGVGGLVVKGAGDMKDFAEIKDVPWGQGVASVTIGEGVTGIGAKSFNGSALGSVTIPASVTNIGAAAFGACASLSKVELKAMTPPTLGGDAFAGCAEGLKIYVPCGAGKAYRAAWPDHVSRIIETIKVKSDEFTVDLRTRVELAGETTVSNVAWSATAWGKVPETFTTVGYTNLSTGATGVFGNLSNIMGEGAKDAVLPAKDGEYILTHSTGGLLSFATFTVSGYPIGCAANPWAVGLEDDPDGVVAWTDGKDNVYFKPPRSAVSRTGLETITNALGGTSFDMLLVAADGAATNDVKMIIGASGRQYTTLEEMLKSGEDSWTLYDVYGYTVNYDGNGAEGEMASETFLPGIPTNLMANAFTAAGYAFEGWTTNGAGDRIVFADRARIANPQPGVIHDLKAVWSAVPTTVGSYDDLKKVLDQAAKFGKPVEIVLDGTITPPAGEALVLPATVDVEFSGDGKIGGLVFKAGPDWFTDSIAEHSDAFAYVDPSLTNIAGLVICNGLPEENRPIDLDALTDAMEKAKYQPAVTPLNALVKTGEGTAAMPAKWVDAASRRVYETLQEAIEAGEKAVTPDFGSEEEPVPPRMIVEEVEVAPGVTVTATMKNDGSGVSGAVQAIGAEGLADFAEARTTSVELDVTAKSSVPTASQLVNAAEKALNGRSTTSTTPHYVDISLWTVAADGAKTAEHKLDEPLAIQIPWTFKAHHAYKVVRCHNGATKVFPETADADGEYAEFDEANGLITVRSKFFSDFAVVDFALATVRITVPAADSLPEGVKSITVKADGAAVQPTTTSGGMSTYEIAVGTPAEVDFEAKSGYAFPETGKGTWTWTPEGGIPAGDKTFSADEIKPDKVRDPLPACVYRFRAHVYTTKGVAQNLRASGSACAPGESSCVVMRGRDKTVIEGWLYQCECVCDGLGESAVIWDAYRKVPLSDAAFETQFLNVIGSRSTDAEWAWTFTGTAVYDSLREQDYELAGSGYGAFNPSAGICTSFSGAFAGTASASYDLVTKRTAATADCVCQPSQVLKCDAVDGVSFELERTAAFGQWKVKYDATASKAYQKGGRLTIPNFIR